MISLSLLLKSRLVQSVAAVLVVIALVSWYANGQVKEALSKFQETLNTQAVDIQEKDQADVNEADKVVRATSDGELNRGLCGGKDCIEADMPSGLDSTSAKESRLFVGPELEQGVQGRADAQQDQSRELFQNLREAELITCSMDELDILNIEEPEHTYECDHGYWVRYESIQEIQEAN